MGQTKSGPTVVDVVVVVVVVVVVSWECWDGYKDPVRSLIIWGEVLMTHDTQPHYHHHPWLPSTASSPTPALAIIIPLSTAGDVRTRTDRSLPHCGQALDSTSWWIEHLSSFFLVTGQEI
jgi:hypothetical protein